MQTYSRKEGSSDSSAIDVSIIMFTYNHAEFVSQAIESILMQEHNLAIEILICDDGSIDGTDKVLKCYKKKYPNLFKLKCFKMNSGYPTRNSYQMMRAARGRYVAFLEGDDYWISPHKLQAQYDFLERHQRYSAHAGNIQVVDENNEVIDNTSVYSPKADKVYTLNDFKTLVMPAMAGGFLCRNIFSEEDLTIMYKADKSMGDYTIYMLCLLHGDIYQSEEIIAAYRYRCVSGGTNFNSINKGNKYREYSFLRYWICLERYIRRHKDKNYRIIIIKDGIMNFGNKYSAAAMLTLLLKAGDLRRLLIYFLSRIAVYDGGANREKKCVSTKSWSQFLLDGSPIIIFGAGHMASLYLDAYAWKNNVLFLVDNDAAKQNTSFKGYLIKNPNVILKQKGKYKILIANDQYEAEIEKQLLDMGIKSYYCFCSMQSERITTRLLRWL